MHTLASMRSCCRIAAAKDTRGNLLHGEGALRGVYTVDNINNELAGFPNTPCPRIVC